MEPFFLLPLGASPDANGRAVSFDHFSRRKWTRANNLGVLFASPRMIMYKVYPSYNISQKNYWCVDKHVCALGQGAEFEFPPLPINFNLSPDTDRWDPPIRPQQGDLC
jgi:hypothetical protein